MMRYARHAALGAVACLALTGCGGIEELGVPTASGPRGSSSDKQAGASGGGKEFTPSEDNQDPTRKIDGVVEAEYEPGKHVKADQRVAYDRKPPLGGAHDGIWAACNGVIYPTAIRTENLVHSMEHGAVWLSYDPAKVTGDDVVALAERVQAKPYTVMSPFPGQPKPVSVQSWGRQLQVDEVDDPRIDQFITATRANPYLSPEPGASCDMVDADLFDQDAPPPFDPTAPGPDAVPPTGE
ncbi:DUF3105 domain-containing protein [Actinokineospora iranica]|uniref:DUF3105 domain-containing protein n=1 Tax=Actinokineospora iranica TaxID=1271860 RepID=A0A1G6M7L9_9PSEU|nr:DUF3105 domain-containing protein [Actinokineospora iranica]SDC51489.1 Protein of unknown function [Actinokineospora iranica]